MVTGGSSTLKHKGNKAETAISSDNVVDLTQYRSRRTPVADHTVYYLSETAPCLEMLYSFQSFGIKTIQTEEQLEKHLALQNPKLILIDSAWNNALDWSTNMAHRLDVPIVMLCQTKNPPKSWIKKAYAAGVSDMLFPPHTREELLETLEVLLKFQNQASQLH